MSIFGYRNPFRAVTGLVPERVDQGVDYSGTGPVYAIGKGDIVTVTSPDTGWEGGSFIAEHLTSGPARGNYVYVAEDISPLVAPGDHVTTNTVIGTMYDGGSGIETGFADPPGTGESLARASGQWNGTNSTAYGVAYSDLLSSTGAPPGIVNNPVQGTIPSGYNFPGNNNSGNPVQTDSVLTSGVGWVSKLFGSDPADLIERGALIVMGGILIVVGIFVLLQRTPPVMTAKKAGKSVAKDAAVTAVA